MDLNHKIGAVWDNKPNVRPQRWYNVPLIIQHVSLKFGQKTATHFLEPFLRRLQKEGPFQKAVSVGCGVANAERKLLERRVVESFDLYELSQQRIEQATLIFQRSGLFPQATFTKGDAFQSQPTDKYDLVYWKSSLHHMMSAEAAVKWSWLALRPGGTFAMWEYVGPTRWQWTDRSLRYLNAFRQALPDRLFVGRERKLSRPTIERMIETDPSEAADSSNIMPAVINYFPNAEIGMLGGALYQIGFRGILDRVLSDLDCDCIIRQALVIDDALQDLGENHFAWCIVRKD